MFEKKDILNIATLWTMRDGDPVDGLVLVKDCQRKIGKGNVAYFDVLVEAVGTVTAKVWNSSAAFSKLEEADYRGEIVWIKGKVNLYGGMLGIVIGDILGADLSETDITSSDFLFSKYNGVSYFKGLREALLKMTNPEILKLFDLVVKGHEERFSLEFAAKGNHDNCKSGLIAHTYKVLYLGKILKKYPNIFKYEGDYDLLYLGAALHDIGKVIEYSDGAIIGLGQVCSHHTFGVEILLQNKVEIVACKGEEFFYRLCAIVEQHHGEYEERPRTVEAYLIHLLDKLESDLQFLDQSLEGLSKGDQVMINGFKLC